MTVKPKLSTYKEKLMTSMVDVLITYDISGKNSEVKAAMLALGYKDSAHKAGTSYALPNSTLWKRVILTRTPLADLEKVAARLEVIVERAFTTRISRWKAIPGEANED